MNIGVRMSIINKTIIVSVGLTCTGIAVSLFLLVSFGLDSISVFTAGLANTFQVTVGVASLSFYFIVIVLTYFLDKHYISGATILSLILVGPAIDFFGILFTPLITPELSMELRMVFFVIAFFFLAFGVSLYLAANFGISAADMIPILLSDKTGIQFRWCKIGFDVTLVIIGIVLGGAFGFGTILVALFTGPAIQYLRGKIENQLIKVSL